MKIRNSSLLVLVSLLAGHAGLAQTPSYNRGRTPTPEEIRAWDFSIGPEGKELPPGSGNSRQGAAVFAQKCAKCHGPTGVEGPVSPPLAGGKRTLRDLHPIKTVGSYWPYATTVWDFINRAMPRDNEGSLKPDEVYGVTAYLLYRNDIIKENDVMDAKSLPKVQMPNRDSFVPPNINNLSDSRKRGCAPGSCP